MKENLLLMNLQKSLVKNKSFDAIVEEFMREEGLFWRSNIVLTVAEKTVNTPTT